MFSIKPKGYLGDGNGLAWPHSPSGVGVVKDTVGHRTFVNHSSGVDFHRGDDLVFSQGQVVYSPLSGAVIRNNFTFFGWQTVGQMDHWTLIGSSLAASHSGSSLILTASRTGESSFPNEISRYQHISERINLNSGSDWLIQIGLTSTINVSGAIGIGLFNSNLSEFIAIGYDGSLITRYGVGTTIFTANATTTSISGQTWLRINYTSNTDTYNWAYSNNGSTWISIGTETGRSFTSSQPIFTPTIFWKAGDTSATPYTIGVQKLEFYDLSQSASSRFGNYLVIANYSGKVVMDHFESLAVGRGDFVSVGQLIGHAGKTGFDSRSGAVLFPHVHLEYHPNTNYSYSNDEAINPLDSNLLPRVDVTNNVNVVRTRENDPEGNDSWRLTITIDRADQDFDVNTISLTGNLGTRSLVVNSRVGLDPIDHDANNYNGVRFSPSGFDENSTAQTLSYYFRTASVGTTFVSYFIADTQDRILASE